MLNKNITLHSKCRDLLHHKSLAVKWKDIKACNDLVLCGKTVIGGPQICFSFYLSKFPANGHNV